jgi:heme/copper-type cytochrome/quinol oxidase subunit 2
MTALLLAFGSVVSSKTLRSVDKADKPDAPNAGGCDVSVLSFTIIAIVIGALCLGAYTLFKHRASREVRQAEEPLLIVDD